MRSFAGKGSGAGFDSGPFVVGKAASLELHHEVDVNILLVAAEIGIPDAAVRVGVARCAAKGADVGRCGRSIFGVSVAYLSDRCSERRCDRRAVHAGELGWEPVVGAVESTRIGWRCHASVACPVGNIRVPVAVLPAPREPLHGHVIVSCRDIPCLERITGGRWVKNVAQSIKKA
jgi:hypothetical protein